jgi:hypothetical protein
MRLYIAGPMRAVPYYNFPCFDAAADDLRAQGHEVVSPTDIDRAHGFDAMTLPPDSDWNAFPPGLTFEIVMKRDLEAVRTCEGLALLPGWQNSVGTNMELDEARRLGLQVFGYLHEKDERGALVPMDRCTR